MPVRRMNILVVDDERDLTDLLRFVLSRAGYTPVTANDGLTALRIARQYPPDLAIVDVNLREVDGFEIVRQLRQQSDMPILMLTGRSAEDDKVRGLELGADDYIT